MADKWFDASKVPVPQNTAARVWNLRQLEENAWSKMAYNRQSFLAAGLPKIRSPKDMNRDNRIKDIHLAPYNLGNNPPETYGVFSAAAPVFHLANTVTKPLTSAYEFLGSLENRNIQKPGNPRKQSIFIEWADALNPPYVHKTVSGIEKIKAKPDISYKSPKQIAGLLPGATNKNLAKK